LNGGLPTPQIGAGHLPIAATSCEDARALQKDIGLRFGEPAREAVQGAWRLSFATRTAARAPLTAWEARP